MDTDAFGRDELAELRELQATRLPGDARYTVGIAFIVVIVLFQCCVSPGLIKLSNEVANDGRPEQPPVLALVWVCTTPVVGIVGVGGPIYLSRMRRKLNAGFVRRNTIYIRYRLGAGSRVYEELLSHCDKLASGDTFEVRRRQDGDYEQVGRVSLVVGLPKYLECNYDVFCLAVGPEKFYLLPDTILAVSGRDIYAVGWKRLLLRVDNIAGRLRYTEYYEEMVHGRIRKDGGLDQRYNTRYQRRGRPAFHAIERYGILQFIFDKEKIIILTPSRHLVEGFRHALERWAELLK